VLSAPSLFGGQLYVETASRCDAPPYRGRIVAIDTATGARTRFWVTGKNGPLGGGIWGWGGASIDPLNGDLFVATGNALGSPQDFPYADRLVRLTGSLLVQAAHDPGPQMPDDDFGSTPVLFQKRGCPPQLVTEQKNGFLYLYDRDAIATGFRQRIAVSSGGDFIGVPAYAPQTQMVYVVNPHQPVGGAYTHGMLAFSVNSKCKLHLAWQTTVGDNGQNIGSTPTVANGVVYYGDGVHNTIHGFDASTGAPLWTSGTDVAGFVFAAPVVVNGQLFAGSYDQHLHAWGL
jgi:hypothetical protein